MKDQGPGGISVFLLGHDFPPEAAAGDTERKATARIPDVSLARRLSTPTGERTSETRRGAMAIGLGGPGNERTIGSESVTDVGFFLSTAVRFPLLDGERERTLARGLWRSRRRLFRAIERARRSRSATPLKVPAGRAHGCRRISQETRRRLIAAEDYAERLLRLIEAEPMAAARFEGSAGLAPPTRWDKRSRRTRSGSWSPPPLNIRQILSIADVLREELETIHDVREEVAQHNLRLVVWVAKTYQGRGLDLADLIQEGSMGLLRAIDRFDPAVGTRFSTFATHWVRQGIGRALAEKARPIRIPLNRLPELREIQAVRSRLTTKLSRAPSVAEIATETRIEPEKVKELLPALSPIGSIDAPLSSGNIQQADTIADVAGLSPLERAMEREKADSVQEVLERMATRQRLILAMRYGIGYPRRCTLEEIGKALGLSRERIRQIEKIAREEFKNGWNGRGSFT